MPGAALLSVLGVYGVTAYTVEQRQKEVPIRMALGASAPLIVRMFLLNGGVLLLAGTAAGLAGSVILARLLSQQMFGLQRFDLAIYIGASTLLAIAGLVAIWWPARRAAAVQPAGSLNAN